MTYRIFGVTVAGTLLLVSAWAVSAAWLPGPVRAQQAGPPRPAAAQKGRAIREAGQIESANNIEVRSEVPGRVTLLDVVPDGSFVKPGDEIVRLDSADLQEKMDAHRRGVIEAELRMAHAKREMDVARQLIEIGSAAKAQQLKVAELALRRLVGKGGELELRGLENKATIVKAEAAIKLAEGQLAENPDVFDRLALEADLNIARKELGVAQAQHQWFETRVRPHETAELEARAMEAKLAQIRSRAEHGRMVGDATLALEQAKIVLDQEKDALKRVTAAVKASVIRAPQAGMVLHNNVKLPGGRAFVIEPGVMVRERQILLRIPDLTKLQIKVRVPESQVARIKVGHPATIEVDAYPNKTINGQVSSVANRPDALSWHGKSDVHYYSVVVRLAKPHPRVRIGMTTVVTIKSP